MLYIVNGIPGSGKTYLMMHIFTTTYYKKSDDNEWIIKENPDNNLPYTIITNIDGLKLPHLNLDEVIKKSGKNILDFFTDTYQKKVAEKHPNLVYVIDECQRYFDHKINNRTDVLYFFEWHRHLGLDIYLISQTYKRINRNIQGLEYKRYQATSRLMSIFGEFTYSIYSGKEQADKKIVRKNKELFTLYKSRERNEQKKSKNPLIKYFWIALILGIFSFVMFYRTFFVNQKKKFEKKVDNYNNVNNQYTTNRRKKDIQKADNIKYYYYLNTAQIHNTITNEDTVYYVDYINHELLPIEIIDLPLIKIKRGDHIKYLVVSNVPNKRFEKPIISNVTSPEDTPERGE